MKPGSLWKSRQLKWIALAGLSVAVVIVFVVKVVSSSSSPPQLVVAAPRLSLGKVEFTDEPLRFEYRLHNAGAQDLLIHSVQPSCGCARILMSAYRIPPGKDELLIVTVVPTRMGWGAVSVALLTNDPLNVRYQLNAEWESFSKMRLSPNALEFGSLPPGQGTVQTITVDHPSGYQIAGVSSSCSDLRVEHAGDQVRVEVTAVRPLGRKNGFVTINSNRGSVEVPVTWDVRGDVDVAPKVLMLTPGGGGHLQGGVRVWVSSPGLDVHWDWAEAIPGVDVTLEEIARGSWKLTATSAAVSERFSRGGITLRCGEDRLVIPVVMIARLPTKP